MVVSQLVMADTLKGCSSEAIIIDSSDDDDDGNVQELFEEFVAKVERSVKQKEVVLFLKLRFAEASSAFVLSSRFIKDLKWRTKILDHTNAYIHTGNICKLLGSNPEKIGLGNPKDGVTNVVNRAESQRSHAKNEMAGNFENKNVVHVTIDGCDPDTIIDEVEEINATSKSSSSKPSASRSQPSLEVEQDQKPDENKAKSSVSSLSRKHKLTPRKRKRIVEKLEHKLKYVSDQIKLLSQAELSLDEMGMGDSTYIQESRLKERFNRIWEKICKVQGRPPDTGRVTEKDVKFQGTGYEEIDRAVNKFLKHRKGKFPDTFDIRNIVSQANKKHGLKLTSAVIDEISGEVFTVIGNKLQKRRKKDFEYNFGCFLTDAFDPSDDPALTNPALHRKLEENKRISKRALDDEFQKYVIYGRVRQNDNGGSSASDDDDDGRGKVLETNSCIRTRDSLTAVSDSSDNECDDFALEHIADLDTIGMFSSPGTTIARSPSDKDFQDKKRRPISVAEVSHSSDDDGDKNTIQGTSGAKHQADSLSMTKQSQLNSTLENSQESPDEKSFATEISDSNHMRIEHDNSVECESIAEVTGCNRNHIQSAQSNACPSTSQDQSVDIKVVIVDSADRTDLISCSSRSIVSVEESTEVVPCSKEEKERNLTSTLSESNLNCSSHSEPGMVESCDTPQTSAPFQSSFNGSTSSFSPTPSQKRKAEDRAMASESPLKLFRSASVKIFGKVQGASCKVTDNRNSNFSESDVRMSPDLSKSSTCGSNICGISQTNTQKKLELSLNKCRRKSLQQTVNGSVCTPDVIVLSDDEESD